METMNPVQSGTQINGTGAFQTAETRTQPPGPNPSAPPVKRRRPSRRKKVIKAVITTVIILAVIVALVWFSYKVFFTEPPEYYLTGYVEVWPEIKNEVTGYGYLTPAKSETVNITQQGNVLECYAFQGMMVNEGALLAVIDSSVIDKTIEEHNKQIAVLEKDIEGIRGQIDKVRAQMNEANAEQIAMRNASRMYAPFSGQIIEAEKITLGEQIKVGTRLGRLVDDSQMRLVLYFSYGYEMDIYPGQTCEVSIPAVMAAVPGKVTGIEKIRRIGADGAVTFEVEILLENPGSLVGGMAATASMTTASGEIILPAEAGVLEFAQEVILTAESQGPLKEYNIRDYYSYQTGDLLMALEFESDSSAEEGYLLTIEGHENNIAAKEEQIEAVRENIALEMERMEDLTVTAPISGTITFTNLEPGMKITETAFATVNIAQLQTLTMQAYIGQSDIHSFKVGMEVDVLVWTQNGETGVKGSITEIDTSAKQEGNWAQYPATITVDNSMGMIMDGSSGSFSAKLAQSENAIVVSIQAVKNVGKGEYVFLRPKDGKKPESAVEVGEGVVPDGFYAIPVKCGITNGRYIEITEGLLPEWEGWDVFTQKTDIKPSPTPESVYEGDNTDPNYISGYDDGYAKGLEDGKLDDGGDVFDDSGLGIIDGGFEDDLGIIDDGFEEFPIVDGDGGVSSEDSIGDGGFVDELPADGEQGGLSPDDSLDLPQTDHTDDTGEDETGAEGSDEGGTEDTDGGGIVAVPDKPMPMPMPRGAR